MKKIKVYLDTSVISYLDQEDAPEKTKETREVWKRFERGEFEIYLSQITLDELERCLEAKKNILYDYLGMIAYTRLNVNDETTALTRRIIELGILKPKNVADCQHIAIAVVNGCDLLLSWNFRHMVNIKTIRGMRAVTNLEGYGNIDIVSPSALLISEEDEDETRNRP